MSTQPKIGTHEASWRGIRVRIVVTRNLVLAGMTTIEVESLEPFHDPLPISETGHWYVTIPTGSPCPNSPVTAILEAMDRRALSSKWLERSQLQLWPAY